VWGVGRKLLCAIGILSFFHSITPKQNYNSEKQNCIFLGMWGGKKNLHRCPKILKTLNQRCTILEQMYSNSLFLSCALLCRSIQLSHTFYQLPCYTQMLNWKTKRDMYHNNETHYDFTSNMTKIKCSIILPRVWTYHLYKNHEFHQLAEKFKCWCTASQEM
jgi:hypothetical protein